MRLAAALLVAATTAAPSVEFSMPIEHRLVEGIASSDHAVFVSSIIDKVIRVQVPGMMGAFTLSDADANPLGLAWDDQRKWLWIATDCPEVSGVKPCDSGALVAMDLKGRVRARYRPDGPLHAGDVSVGNGSVFVSDSRNGAVYRLPPKNRKLAVVVAPGVGRSAQGSALSPDGKSLIVADYSLGIARIDLTSGKRTLILLDGKPLRGMDGLARAGDWYVGVQNGGSVGRLLAFRIVDGALDLKILSEGGLLTDPTQLTVTKDAILVVADSGWATIAKPEPRTVPATIVRFPLP